MRQQRNVILLWITAATCLSFLHCPIALIVFVNAKGKETDGSNCLLPCRNKGICRTSSRRELTVVPNSTNMDVPATRSSNYSNNNSIFSLRILQQHHQQYPHCLCPVGYTGTLCEIVYQTCDSSSDVCASGATCQRAVDNFGIEFFHCGCDLAKSDLSLPKSLEFCQRVSTVFCNTVNDDPKQSRGSSYCTNGGRCKETENQKDTTASKLHSGCTCLSGTEGAHCETINLNTQGTAWLELETMTGNATTKKRRILLSMVVFISLLSFFLTAGYTAAVYYAQVQQKKHWKNRRGKTAEERARIPRAVGIRGRILPNYEPMQTITTARNTVEPAETGIEMT